MHRSLGGNSHKSSVSDMLMCNDKLECGINRIESMSLTFQKVVIYSWFALLILVSSLRVVCIVFGLVTSDAKKSHVFDVDQVILHVNMFITLAICVLSLTSMYQLTRSCNGWTDVMKTFALTSFLFGSETIIAWYSLGFV
jgi:hypothetical protein